MVQEHTTMPVQIPPPELTGHVSLLAAKPNVRAPTMILRIPRIICRLHRQRTVNRYAPILDIRYTLSVIANVTLAPERC